VRRKYNSTACNKTTYDKRRLNTPTLVKTKTNSVTLVSEQTIPTEQDRRLSAKLVPTFADTGCHVVSATDPHGRILGILYRLVKTTSSNKARGQNSGCIKLTLAVGLLAIAKE
jgi:CBS-domain-containing membrane protein